MGSKKKRVLATFIALALVLALGLAGTFAWSGGEDSDGEIADTVTPGVKLHDDYDTTLAPSTVTRDRKIYVENTGAAALYIRVKLNEYMEYAGRSLIRGGVRADKTTWSPHVPSGTNTVDCEGIHDYFTLGLGGQTQYNKGVKNRFAADGTDNFDAVNALTTEDAAIITMDEYSAMTDAQKAAKKYWVYDTDGYAYWSEKLAAKDMTTGDTKATGLLLNNIVNTGIIDENFYYGIHAKMEAVTESDLSGWLTGSSASGQMERASTKAVVVLKEISNKYIKITDAMKNTTPSASGFDGDHDGFLTKSENNDYLASNPVTPGP